MKKLIKSLVLVLFCGSAWADTVIFKDHTVETYTKDRAGPTVLYIPGCNGLDRIGQRYQAFHREAFAKVYPEANFVVAQYTNDITKGADGGRCFWNEWTDPRLRDHQAHDQAKWVRALARWIKQQPWSNGVVHLFGFSYGGRVGLFLPARPIGREGLFNSVALIWPYCRSDAHYLMKDLHTPTRIWATEGDPISQASNCPSYYAGGHDLLTLTLYPGSDHSWFTHPMFTGSWTEWPWLGTRTWDRFDQRLFDRTMQDWRSWAKSYEVTQ